MLIINNLNDKRDWFWSAGNCIDDWSGFNYEQRCHDMRKPVLVRHRPACASTQPEQFFLYALSRQYHRSDIAVFWYSQTPYMDSLLVLLVYDPVNNLAVMSGRVFLCWISTKQRIKFLAHGTTQCRDEARTRNPSISSQALYHWTTALLLLHAGYFSSADFF